MQERAFDYWLNRQLHQLYDQVLSEEVPEEIVRLLDKFDQGSDEPPSGDEKSQA